jgi:hypothetical protein
MTPTAQRPSTPARPAYASASTARGLRRNHGVPWHQQHRHRDHAGSSGRRQYTATARPASANTKIKSPQPSLIITAGLGRCIGTERTTPFTSYGSDCPTVGCGTPQVARSAHAPQWPSRHRWSAAPRLARLRERRSQHHRPARWTTPAEASPGRQGYPTGPPWRAVREQPIPRPPALPHFAMDAPTRLHPTPCSQLIIAVTGQRINAASSR